MTIARLARLAAVLIAFAGIVDPGFVSARATRPTVAVLTPPGAGPADRALAARTSRLLERTFDVVPAVTPDSVAVVSIGDRLPADATVIAPPSFAVLPSTAGPHVVIDSIRAPRRAPSGARVPVTAEMRITGGRGRTLAVSLMDDGVTLDRTTHEIATDDERRVVTLSLTPAREGWTTIRVAAEVAGDSGPRAQAAADVGVDLERRAWTILALDTRVSWMSRFVRRALEADARFAVANRTATSTAAFTTTPGAPAGLTDAASLARFDAIVIGGPEGLSAGDVAGLERYLRERGGSVVLLYDASGPAGPVDRLTGVARWQEETRASPAAIAMPIATGAAVIQARELIQPARLPDGADPIASRRDDGAAAGTPSTAIVWRQAVGAGRVIVSGALDGWRYRAASGVSFDEFWQQAIGAAAEAAPPPIDVSIAPAVVAPGESTGATVTIRELALAAPRASVEATLEARIEGPGGVMVVRAWPAAVPGEFTVRIPAQEAPGEYRLRVARGGDQASAGWAVRADARAATGSEPALVEMWARSRGGRVIAESQIAHLPAAIEQVARPERREEMWHPMRSAWWMLPFAAALGVAWKTTSGVVSQK